MSSLIFVVILAVWAVYLVQHWVRRRDHLATARSVDRFSEAMRVLERRRALPRPDLAERAPASASVPLLRPARPEVVVKRGAPAAARVAARPAGSTAVAPSAAYRRRKRSAQVRAAGLLASSLVMVVLAGLVGFQLVHWGWAFAGIALLAATVGGLRLSVARSRRAAAPARATAPRTAPARPAPAVRTAPAPAPAAQDRTGPAAQARPARRRVDLTASPAAAAPPALYDVEEVEAALVSGEPHETEVARPEQAVSDQAVSDQAVSEQAVPEQAAPGEWSPVPVPPPTYTLKARAYRAPAELPADGAEMALEEEFEELPPVRSVG